MYSCDSFMERVDIDDEASEETPRTQRPPSSSRHEGALLERDMKHNP
jgi:hypothetical protein